jgi:hypothetical protein
MIRVYSITQTSDLHRRQAVDDEPQSFLSRLRFLPFAVAAFLFDRTESGF